MMNAGFLLLRRSWFAWLAVAVLSTAGTPAQAASTHVGEDYIEDSQPPCSDKTECTITFAKIPAGMELLVTRVTCTIDINDPNGRVATSMLGRKQGITLGRPNSTLVPVIVAVYASKVRASINSEVFHPFTGDQSPQILLEANPGAFNILLCSIAGVMKAAAPQSH